MNSIERILHQRHKEQKALKLFLLSSVLGSLAVHSIAMTVRVGNFWNPGSDHPQEDEMEVVVEEASAEQPIAETPIAEPEESATTVATVQEVAIASQLAPAPIPLAPQSQAPLPAGEDAPRKDASSDPKTDPISPLTNKTGETPIQSGGAGSIINPVGKGFGFGFSGLGTGFNLNGKPTGQPDGKPGGQEDGKSSGDPAGRPGPGETAVRTVPLNRARPKKPVCLECPKPRFRGSEGSARVTYDIGPDGKVTNVRLRQSSGDLDLDRETIEAMSKWRFDPRTVPEGGRQNVRTRITFEEEGSNYQRQNDQRRQGGQQRRQVADQEQPQRLSESSPRKPTATNEPLAKPTFAPEDKPNTIPAVEPSSPTVRQNEGIAPSPPAPALTPTVESLPAPIEATPAPSPGEAPAPASPASSAP